MPYIIVENFKGGLDTRRSVLASAPGTLASFINAHVTRGGEVEKRKAFVKIAALTGTYGIESTVDKINIFVRPGYVAPTGTPAIINFITLTHPYDPSALLSEIQYSNIYSGKTFALAKFTNGEIIPFFDGVYIADFLNGTVNTVNRYTGVQMAAHISALTQQRIDKYLAEFNAGTTDGDPFRKYSVTQLYSTAVEGIIGATINTLAGRVGYATIPKITGIYLATSNTTNLGNEISGLTTAVDAKNYYAYDQTGAFALDATEANNQTKRFYYNVNRIINNRSSVSKITSTFWTSTWGGENPASIALKTVDKTDQFNNKGLYIEFENTTFSVPDGLGTIVTSPYNSTRKLAQIVTVGDIYFGEIRNGVTPVASTILPKIKITGPTGNVDFGYKAYVSVADDPAYTPTVTATRTIKATSGSVAVAAKASFSITGGDNGDATLYIGGRYGYDYFPLLTGIYIGTDSPTSTSGKEISGLLFAVNPKEYYPYNDEGDGYIGSEAQKFHHCIKRIINANSALTNFTVTEDRAHTNWSGPDPTSTTYYCPPDQGVQYNGARLILEFEGTGSYSGGDNLSSLYASPFNPGRRIAYFGGSFAGGSNNCISSVKAGGNELLKKPLYWKTSHEQLAADIVEAINNGPMKDEYNSYRNAAIVYIEPNDLTNVELEYNNQSLAVIRDGTIAVSAISIFTGGLNKVDGRAKEVEFEFLNYSANSIGSETWIMITDPTNPDVPYKIGATRVASKQPKSTFTYKGKEYLSVGSTVFFSALNDATKWDIYDIGSGFIDMSNNFGGREDIIGMGIFQGYVAVFTKTNAQLWYFDPDPTKNQQFQIVDNTGCISPSSVCSIGSLDLLYLASNGIRSLRTRQATDSPYASDVGSPIDEIIIDKISTMTSDEILKCRSIVDPTDGRYWLRIKDRMFVLSSFYGSSINAWSEYNLGFEMDDMVLMGGSIYVRDTSGNIYQYGGTTGNEYDSCKVTIEMPYLDANKPATIKSFHGVDATVLGEWKVYLGFDHTASDQKDLVAIVNQPTFALGKIMCTGIGTHLGVRMESETAGKAKIANFIAHFDELYSKHEAG